MSTNGAMTVEEYLAGLPAERREVVARVREVVLQNLPDGYEERMGFGMITWCVPLARYPDTYNGQPLCYASLAAQKNHYSLHLMGAYGDPAKRAALEAAFHDAGKRLDMGKSCVRFRRLDDLPLEGIARVIGATPVEEMIRLTDAARRERGSRRPGA